MGIRITLTRGFLLIGFGLLSSLTASAAGERDATSPPPYQYLPSPGPYTVTTVDDLALRDETRKKIVPVKAYVPEGKGPFPVVLFSHGAGESDESAPNLFLHWASYGYVCLNPGHTQEKEEASGFSIGRFVREFSLIKDLGDAQAFGNRVDDLKLVLDRLDELEAQAPVLKGKLDRAHIGVAGHSLGAVTAVLIGGATLTPEGQKTTWHFGDKRVSAIIVMSGAGLDPASGFRKTSWDGVTIPMMVITGSKDPGRFGKYWRTDPYEYAPKGDKYLLYILGANHVSYIGVGQPESFPKAKVARPNDLPDYKKMFRKHFPSIAQEGIFQYVLMATTAFWDAYLKDEPQGKAFLDSNQLPDYSFGQAEIKHK